MYILPAIDLMKGKCVRLIQGDYNRQITYEDDPVKQAQSFSSDGAQWLHVVDLDGAKVGKPVNTKAIREIAALDLLKIEVGGGIREQASIEELLHIGVTRVIIGTKAANDFDWFSKMAQKFPNKLALGLDAKGSKVVTHGWTQSNAQPLLDFAKTAAQLPIAAIIYTDVTKDGMMSGPNFERTKELADNVPVPVIASGGINSIEDIQKLKQVPNIEGAIIGRSLYEGTLTLTACFNAAQ